MLCVDILISYELRQPGPRSSSAAAVDYDEGSIQFTVVFSPQFHEQGERY